MRLFNDRHQFRLHTAILHTVWQNIKTGKWDSRNKDQFLYTQSDIDSVINHICEGYPLRDIGAKEDRNGKLTLHTNTAWEIVFAFLDERITYKGKTLYEFEDPGLFESLTVHIMISSPSCPLDPARF